MKAGGWRLQAEGWEMGLLGIANFTHFENTVLHVQNSENSDVPQYLFQQRPPNLKFLGVPKHMLDFVLDI